MEEHPGQSGLLRRKLSVHQLDLLVRQLDSLPPLPAVAARALELTARARDLAEPAEALDELARLAALDPALAARLLSLAAAPPAGPCPTIQQAVRDLGVDAVRAAVLSMPAAQPPCEDGLDHAAFWRHCLAVASAAEMLVARAAPTLDADEAFAAGLLHDLGRLALACLMPKSYARVLDTARARGLAAADAERDVLGVDHFVAGRRLAECWQLPASIRDAAWLHGQPGDVLPASVACPELIRIVHLADAIARRRRIGLSVGATPAEPVERLARSLGIDPEAAADVADALADHVDARGHAIGAEKPDDGAGLREALAGAGEELGRLNEQLRRRGQALSAQARAFGLFCDFAAALAPDASVPDVLARAAEAFQAAGDPGSTRPGTVVAYCLDPQAGSIVAARRDAAGRAAWQDFALAGELPPPPTPRPGPAGRLLASLLAEPDRWHAWADTAGCDHRPLFCGRQWLGGMVYPAGAAGEADEALQALAAALGMALGIVQQRSRAVALGEELARAVQQAARREQARADQHVLAAVRDLAAGAAHELNTALAVVSGRAQLMRDKTRSKRQRQTCETIIDQVERVSGIIADLMDFAHPPRPKPQDVDAAELLAAAAETFARSDHPQAASCRVDIEVEDGAPAVRADAEQIVAVLAELIANAAAAGGETARVRLTARADEPAGAVVLAVRDDGPGMDEMTAARACTPFFSAHAAGRRTGLGLPKAMRYVQNNGGSLRIDSRLGEGTTVTIQLPARPDAGRLTGQLDG